MPTTIKVSNTFHSTEANFQVDAKGNFSIRTFKRVDKALCGIPGCRCEEHSDFGCHVEPIYDGSRLVGLHFGKEGVA